MDYIHVLFYYIRKYVTKLNIIHFGICLVSILYIYIYLCVLCICIC